MSQYKIMLMSVDLKECFRGTVSCSGLVIYCTCTALVQVLNYTKLTFAIHIVCLCCRATVVDNFVLYYTEIRSREL